MARKQYPLRVDPQVWAAVERWAADEMRSTNGQVEWLIRDALRRAGRLPDKAPPARTNRRAVSAGDGDVPGGGTAGGPSGADGDPEAVQADGRPGA